MPSYFGPFISLHVGSFWLFLVQQLSPSKCLRHVKMQFGHNLVFSSQVITEPIYQSEDNKASYGPLTSGLFLEAKITKKIKISVRCRLSPSEGHRKARLTVDICWTRVRLRISEETSTGLVVKRSLRCT